MHDALGDELLALGLLIERRGSAPESTLGLAPELFWDKTCRAVVRLVFTHAEIILGSPPWTGEIGPCINAALTSIERDRIDRVEVEAALTRVRGRTSTHPEGENPFQSLNLITAADVQPEAVSWLWNGCLAAGKLTVVEGDPGMSKTTLAIAVAAAISMGAALPGGPDVEQADVLLATYEDGIADTIRPRLEAAGTDLKRVHCIDGVGTEKDQFTIPMHLGLLAKRVVETGARLVIIDPLSAALSGKVNSYNDHDIRRALAPLAKLAEETGAAILVLRHLVKAGGSRAIVAGGGSIAITAAARVVLRVDEDPDDSNRRILSVVKCNLTARVPSRAFCVDERLVVGAGPHPVIRWDGESALSADDLAAARTDRLETNEGTAKVDDARAFLSEWLADGDKSWKVIDKLAKAQDISPGTLNRAAKRLGVVKRRTGHGSSHTCMWSLPTPITPIAPMGTSEADGSDGSDALWLWDRMDQSSRPTLRPSTPNGQQTRSPRIVEECL